MKVHPFRWLPLIFGSIFAAITIGWFLLGHDVMTPTEVKIAAPVALIAVGIMGVIATFTRSRS